ncbi:MAG: hypothetical protein ACR2RF_03675 [Geminicoccaceae bacterium]
MTGIYIHKPNPEFKTNGRKCWIENWSDRMAEDKTRVEVHLSTDTSGHPWDSWELSGEPADVFARVKKHMEFRREHNTLQPGRYCITVPGTDRRHSFEVE